MLQITNLDTELVKAVNLELKPNQIIAITGNNGSGKSTLAKTIGGYYQSEAGAVNLELDQIGLLTQNPFLQFIGNTVFDELTYSLEQQAVDYRRIEAILDGCQFELSKQLNTLSGGQAQRLLIYKEMKSDKQVLILDETLSNLDEVNKQAIIAELRTSGKAIILITNNLNDTKYADITYKLESNRLQEVTTIYVAENLLENTNQSSFEYKGMNFQYGINLIVGQSAGGKSTLINNLCFEIVDNISLLPQYPFEIVTTLDGRHLFESEYADMIGLHPSKFEQNITELSTGELVKLLIIDAIESGNKILVLDESIEVLDRESQTKVLDLIEAKFETILIVTHNKYLFNNRQVNVVEVECNQ